MGNILHKNSNRGRAIFVINLATASCRPSIWFHRNDMHYIVVNGFNTGKEVIVSRMSDQLRKHNGIERAVIVVGEDSEDDQKIWRIRMFLISNGIHLVRIRKHDGTALVSNDSDEDVDICADTCADPSAATSSADARTELLVDIVIDNLLRLCGDPVAIASRACYPRQS